MNKLSKIFQPIHIIPKDAIIKNKEITSKSQRLMLELGLIKATGHGCFHLLPLMQKSLEKLITIIDVHMNKINAQKMTMPHLTAIDLWEKTGRISTGNTELLTTKDRHDKIQILSPTHEESITSMLTSMTSTISYKQFPLRLYQIGTKFRDELKPRFGLLRAKEFLMKDCYSFDIDKESAAHSYNEMNCIYKEIFDTINVPYTKVTGDTGEIGGSLSHEYHYTASIGEDILIQCKNCQFSSNTQICGNVNICPECNSKNISRAQGIEIGHTFLLDDKYSKPLNLKYLDSAGKHNQHVLMGCYGIGITRLLAASIEVLSLENEIRWPFRLAPFKICIIPPKSGSKEESIVEHYTERIYRQLNDINGFIGSIVIDDNCSMTIGKRLLNAKRFGYPLIIVVGAKAINETFELINLMDDTVMDLNFNELIMESVNVLNKH